MWMKFAGWNTRSVCVAVGASKHTLKQQTFCKHYSEIAYLEESTMTTWNRNIEIIAIFDFMSTSLNSISNIEHFLPTLAKADKLGIHSYTILGWRSQNWGISNTLWPSLFTCTQPLNRQRLGCGTCAIVEKIMVCWFSMTFKLNGWLVPQSNMAAPHSVPLMGLAVRTM